ncbi:MAG: S-adenosylmethionine:tRNA ribosyltransferase-isomerase, partial [Chlorobi bacterium]|nr:S-adenosylmethionine:tRNA ribosyltransferase-isomerase [Chlorobiota bacterium]
MNMPKINIEEFNYNLPKEKIAQFPLEKRDESKLVIYKDGEISETTFKHIPELLPENSLMIYNETKVVQARLLFRKETGANIEIFCLEPVEPTREIQQAFEQHSGVVWKCLVGNSKKWKSGKLNKSFTNNGKEAILSAERLEQHSSFSLIRFEWKPETLTFSDILLQSGIIPLPPYMDRKVIDSDKYRYQTVYANSEGSVAAPTAGLHFTEEVFEELKRKNISFEEVTLHVGAGTFKPVSTSDVREHEMHTEQIFVKKTVIENILGYNGKNIIVVGTTTTRTIESLYWFGVKLIVDKTEPDSIGIKQWDPYQPKYNTGISVKESLEAVLSLMQRRNLEVVSGKTQLIIIPGYKYRIPNILITNFHMPQSTLLLLVSAFIGDKWKDVYEFALKHDFRFLSYGDSCLFFSPS